MLPMQMINMFGAVRPKSRERAPYGDARKQTVPTPEEAQNVLQSLGQGDGLNVSDQNRLLQVQAILQDLSEGDSESFLRLSDADFEDHNIFIAEHIAAQQISQVEAQAQDESKNFLEKNASFFDHLRDEGLNYDHLTAEQVEVMRLRMKERTVSQKLEKNADNTASEVFYQYQLGPDDRYYKSGGVVLGSEKSQKIDSELAKKVMDEAKDDDFMGNFADLDALRMPTKRRSPS